MNTWSRTTDLLPLNTQPRREFIVADPEKVDMFARANAIRFGVHSSAGAFHGLGLTEMPPAATASAGSTQTAGSAQSVGSFFGNLGRTLLGSLTAGQQAAQIPPAAPVIVEDHTTRDVLLGVAAVGAVGFIGYKLWKKR